ncbi:asparagine synthase (glutamine-hydrolyzing) [Terasakiella sp. A23]|uniref:asparagine synthase (glutamine-hydrolyzing) n=1 Tax=Terasakiella sp. FCG-A23 TaxID=3080561 RepID=UPI002953D2D2|nr:asparagine synthase (glutamine-hydrolyzing) [Terasakiella sp. A23]MDV7340831.1 asparagine synthase (glutamine-hydrolyzing) [Terasakiella sp. A23]
MCGLVGFLGQGKGADEAAQLLEKMTDQIISRGPDDQGHWVDDTGIALGFRRLSIQDLSQAGHQPMASACGRYMMVFNGEIYNFQDLRAEIEGENWTGHSDTEVILALISRIGFEATLAKLNGMFAIALWDKQDQRLFLARDRMGEKPLYYGSEKGTFFFASEVRALKPHPDFTATINPKAANAYFRFAYVPDPLCIYENFAKLEPGHFLTVKAGEAPKVQAFWKPEDEFIKARSNPFAGSRDEATAELKKRLLKGVEQRMVADVPVGAFLSGGIDSSTVVGLMNDVAPGRVRSFAIGFDNPRFDESPHAEAVAEHLKTDHTTFKMSEQDCLDVIPSLQDVYDEPFSDPSQVPTTLLCRLARQHVTVTMAGDGGDELFGGYGRYWDAAKHWRKVHHMSGFRKGLNKKILMSMAHSPSRMARRFRKKLNRLYHETPAEYYANHMSRWRMDEGLYRADQLAHNIYDEPLVDGEDVSLERSLMHRDTVAYLPSNLLVKTDRASMSTSLEIRAPLLDHDLIEFIWSLPDAYTVDDHKKGILRDVLYQYVPPAIVDRPKQGFEPPLIDWLRGPLKDWGDDLLSISRIKDNPYYNADVVQSRWQDHRSGKRAWTYPLWTVLMFEAWLDQQ